MRTVQPGTSTDRVVGETRYLVVTALVAEPPRLLRTVMFCGLFGQVNLPLNLPPPVPVNVPMRSPVAVTYAVSVAPAAVLVAWTESCRFETRYWARVIATVSAGTLTTIETVVVPKAPPLSATVSRAVNVPKVV